MYSVYGWMYVSIADPAVIRITPLQRSTANDRLCLLFPQPVWPSPTQSVGGCRPFPHCQALPSSSILPPLRPLLRPASAPSSSSLQIFRKGTRPCLEQGIFLEPPSTTSHEIHTCTYLRVSISPIVSGHHRPEKSGGFGFLLGRRCYTTEAGTIYFGIPRGTR